MCSFPGRPHSVHSKCKYKVNANSSWLPPENPSNEWHKFLPHCCCQTGWGAKQTLQHPKEPVPTSPWLCGVRARGFHCQQSHRVGNSALRVQKIVGKNDPTPLDCSMGQPRTRAASPGGSIHSCLQGHSPTRQRQPFHFNNFNKIKCSSCKISLFFVRRTIHFRAALLVSCWTWSSIFATISPLQWNKPAALMGQCPGDCTAFPLWVQVIPLQRNLEKFAATRSPV